MASVRRKPGTQFWFACYTDHEGFQRQRSTKCVNRARAQSMAEQFEEAYRKRQTEAQVRRVMAGIFEEVSGEKLTHVTLADWFTTWLERVKPEISPGTFSRYSEIVALLRATGPKMCAKTIDRVEAKDVRELRDVLVASRSRGTTNLTLKVLRQIFKSAWTEGLVSENPAARVPMVRVDDREEEETKRPFTLAEIRKILAIADDEWTGMIYAGLYTAGQRLSDIATMTPANVDLRARLVKFSTDKTGRDVIVPIVAPWLADLKARVAAVKPGAPLFPKAAARFKAAGGRVGPISNSFRRLLARIGLAPKSNRARAGAVAGRRKVNPLSFHSFRHTATSLLKNAGVSDSVVMDLVGHESEAVSRNYTHIDDATKRAALEKLPTI